jgi:cysteine desulfurase/selenocysteine lyase
VHGPADPERQGGVVAFSLGDRDPRQVALVLDGENVAVRAGHHCGQPLLRALGLGPGRPRSFYVYTTEEEIDRLIGALHLARRRLASQPALSRPAVATCGVAA